MKVILKNYYWPNLKDKDQKYVKTLLNKTDLEAELSLTQPQRWRWGVW